VPARLVDDVCSVYAFCRWADDLSDESGSPRRARELLHWWEDELKRCFDGRATHPVFVALRGTVERRGLPVKPFSDLISAFLQDQSTTHYAGWDQLLDYCSRSAAPVGRLVLMLFDERSEALRRPSDATCTALQLVNFWQDVRRDLRERDRVYIPSDITSKHGLTPAGLRQCAEGEGRVEPTLDESYRATLRDVCDRTALLFDEGRPLLRMVGPELRPVLKLFSLGGETLLRAIRRMDYRTYSRRPRLSRLTKARLLGRVWLTHKLGVA
jgi:squalene synthase HpnC